MDKDIKAKKFIVYIRALKKDRVKKNKSLNNKMKQKKLEKK